MSSKKSSDGLNQSVLKCLRGEGTKKDAKNAFRFFHDKATSGQAQAQFEYGHALFTGFGNDDFKDSTAAIDELQLAVDQDHIEAQFYLAQAYHDGEGVEQDYIMAVHFYTNPAEQGNADAQYRLGRCIEAGVREEWWEEDNLKDQEIQSFEESMDKRGDKGTPLYWYKLAAEQGHIEAQYQIGTRGLGLKLKGVKNWPKLDETESHRWLETAAKQGHQRAQWQVGCAYLPGEGRLARGLKKSTAKAFQFFKAAAEQGNVEAQYFVADAYATGTGVKIDKEKAVKWFIKAARNKSRYRSPSDEINGVEVGGFLHEIAGELSYYNHLINEYLGEEWFPRTHAHFRLGEVFLKGDGITKDETKAKACFKLAAKHHIEKAKEYLALIKHGVKTKEENNKPSIFERSTLDIIAAGENEEIEYKETFSLNTRTGQNNDKKIRYATVREVAGFLNSRDGVLLIGVSDAQIVTGVECDGFEGNGDKYALKINDVIMSAIGDAATASCVKIKLDVIVDKTVCRIECKKSKKPVYCTYQGDEKLFIRIGSSTKEPKPSEWDKWKDTNFD